MRRAVLEANRGSLLKRRAELDQIAVRNSGIFLQSSAKHTARSRLTGTVLRCLGIFLPLLFSAATFAAPPPRIARVTHDQIRTLQEEKLSRTPIQKKLDSQLLYGLQEKQHGFAHARVRSLRPALELEPD